MLTISCTGDITLKLAESLGSLLHLEANEINIDPQINHQSEMSQTESDQMKMDGMGEILNYVLYLVMLK